MTINQIKTLAAILLGTLAFVSISSAQYYDPNYNNNNNYNNNYYNSNSNYNSGYNNYGNNPNNGVVSFTVGYNSDYYANYYNNNYNNSYIAPVSVSGTSYNYNNYVAPFYTYLTPTTYSATNITYNNATINGNITMTGNYGYTSGGTAWFQYGPNQNSLTSSTNPANIYSNTSINAYLTGLSCGTIYYFRAVSSGQNGNNSGVQYGNTLSFGTANCNYTYNYNNNYNNQYYEQPIYYPRQNVTTQCSYATKYKKYWR